MPVEGKASSLSRNAKKKYETYRDTSGALAEVLQPAASFPYGRTLGPTDKVVAAYLACISAIAVISAPRVPLWPLFVVGHAAVVAILGIAAKKFGESSKNPGETTSRRPVVASAVQLARSWYPVVLVPLAYKELEYLVPRVHPRDLDWRLAAIDYRIFGVNPTVWLERVTFPAFTEIFQLAYISYYFLPLAVGVPLWLEGRYRQYHMLLFALVLCFFISYIGYMTVPAVGPRFILNDQQSFALEGVFLYAPIRSTLDWAEGITRDCFPSGHTAIAVLVLYYAWRFRRGTFWILLPVGTLLIMSTVYLRYHYVIDVIAGVALALFVIIVAKPLHRLLGGDPAG
ncbi:MAG TPA: phosphatase PAP2 family protein [Blastocatellia bacterium]|nr:phosphatase PAP2 family protein [Blastocatellia bacterium]